MVRVDTTMKTHSSRRNMSSHRGGRFSPRDNTLESVGPAGRIRGHAHQLAEKYTTLGKEALSARDFVEAENFFQHAEHYRKLSSHQRAAKQVQQSEPAQGEQQAEKSTHAISPKGTHSGHGEGEPVGSKTHKKADTEELPSFIAASPSSVTPSEGAAAKAPTVEQPEKTAKKTTPKSRTQKAPGTNAGKTQAHEAQTEKSVAKET